MYTFNFQGDKMEVPMQPDELYEENIALKKQLVQPCKGQQPTVDVKVSIEHTINQHTCILQNIILWL